MCIVPNIDPVDKLLKLLESVTDDLDLIRHPSLR
jgi:hypothetical protein